MSYRWPAAFHLKRRLHLKASHGGHGPKSEVIDMMIIELTMSVPTSLYHAAVIVRCPPRATSPLGP